MKTKWIVMAFLVLILTACDQDCNPNGPDDPPNPCDPVIGEDFQVKVTFDYYRPEIINPNATDTVVILGSFTDFQAKLMTEIETDHFQYICSIKANSYPRVQSNIHLVGISDAKRIVTGSDSLFPDIILANGVELIKRHYSGSGYCDEFYVDKCGGIFQ